MLSNLSVFSYFKILLGEGNFTSYFLTISNQTITSFSVNPFRDLWDSVMTCNISKMAAFSLELLVPYKYRYLQTSKFIIIWYSLIVWCMKVIFFTLTFSFHTIHVIFQQGREMPLAYTIWTNSLVCPESRNLTFCSAVFPVTGCMQFFQLHAR